LGPPADTEIVVFSDSFPDLVTAVKWGQARFDLRHLAASTKFPNAGYVTGAAFYRFFLPSLCEGAKRILYIDIDTYPVDSRVWRIFDLDMGHYALAAVRDFPSTFARLLNSGVLLIDTLRYAQENLEQRFLATSMSRSLPDQTAMNAVLQRDWLELSPAFNSMMPEVRSAIWRFAPVIQHFAGPDKPWNSTRGSGTVGPALEAFFRTTPWSKFPRRMKAVTPTVPTAAFMDAATNYIEHTTFADVEQGITPPASVGLG